MKSFSNSLLLTLILTTVTIGRIFATSYTNEEAVPSTLFDHMQVGQMLEVTLEMDLESLINNKRTNEFMPAKFSFRNSKGQLTNWDIEVRVRGRFRRITCEFPPLKLKFPKKEMKAEGFGKHNDVKLVTHCMEDKKAVETLFREYLAYQMYNELTNISFRTQLINITYRDTKTGSETSTYGILIEDSDELAERLNAWDCEDCFGMTTDDFDISNLQIHDLFQYMVGNTDWSVPMVRNMKILKSTTANEKSLVAPYDFDFSGLVDAAYARPNPDLQQTDIRDRYYLGGEWTAEEWKTTLDLFQRKEEKLLNIIDQFEFLSRKSKKDMKKYLDSFYRELNDGFLPKKYVPQAKE